MAILLLSIASACETTGQEEPTANNGSAIVASTPSTTVDEAADPKEVSLSWKETMGGSVKNASDTLVAELSNNTNVAQSGRLLLVGLGLDGRIVTRPMGTYKLAANAKSTVKVPLSALPVQSEVAASFAVLQVEYDRSQGSVHSQTRPLYHIFSGGYAKAELYSADELRKLPDGGLRTKDRMDVKGRVWNSTTSAMVAVDARANSAAGDVQQGLTIPATAVSGTLTKSLRGKPLINAQAAAAAAPGAAPLAATSSLRVCLYWDVWYSDSGFGEDVWNTQPWMFVPASYVYAVVGDATARYFEGNVDKSGCTPYVSVPASSTVSAIWWTDWQIDSARGIQFDNLYSLNGQFDPTPGNFQSTVVSMDVTTPRSGRSQSKNLQPTYNDDVIQAAAVTGLILKTNDDRLVAGLDPLMTHTNISQQLLVNVGCGYIDNPNLSDPTTACPGRIGWQSGGNGEPGVWWKFLIAHELGHIFGPQLWVEGSSVPNYNDPLPYCTCDHVVSMKPHCLQKTYSAYGASGEGSAHSFASKLWNTDSQANGKFVYYKKFLNTDGSIIFPPYGYEAYNPPRWMESHCTGGPDFHDLGNEWDWMTFQYNVTARDRANRTMSTDFGSIMVLSCWDQASDCYPRWSRTASLPEDKYYIPILDAARSLWGGSPSDPRYQRFQQAGFNHGIAHN